MLTASINDKFVLFCFFCPQKRVASVFHISFPVFQNNSTLENLISNIQDEKAVLNPLDITSSHCTTMCYILRVSCGRLNQKVGKAYPIS